MACFQFKITEGVGSFLAAILMFVLHRVENIAQRRDKFRMRIVMCCWDHIISVRQFLVDRSPKLHVFVLHFREPSLIENTSPCYWGCNEIAIHSGYRGSLMYKKSQTQVVLCAKSRHGLRDFCFIFISWVIPYCSQRMSFMILKTS